MFGPESTPYLHAGTAFLAPIQTIASKTTCGRALSRHRNPYESDLQPFGAVDLRLHD